MADRTLEQAWYNTNSFNEKQTTVHEPEPKAVLYDNRGKPLAYDRRVGFRPLRDRK